MHRQGTPSTQAPEQVTGGEVPRAACVHGGTAAERAVVARVVVVTYQGAHLLPSCLDALRSQTLAPEDYEVVLVDNASTDGTPELVAARYPWVRLVRMPRNMGFAGGCNAGLGDLTAPFAVLVNNDARVAPDFLARLIAAMQAPGWENVGAATCHLLLAARFRRVEEGQEPSHVVRSPDGLFVPDPQGDVQLVNSTGNVVRTDGYGQDRDWLAVEGAARPAATVFGFCGAAAVLRSEALREVGGMDPDFFLYYEDSDLSWRLRLAGWDVRYVPEARAWHEHSATSREGSTIFRFHDDRNRLLLVTKNAPWDLALRVVLRYPLTALSLAVQEWPHLKRSVVRLRVIGSYLRLLPRMLARRRALGRRAHVPRRAVAALLVPPPPRPMGGYRSWQ